MDELLELGKQVLASQPFSVLVGAELTAFSVGTTSATEGLRLAELERPELILLDINMPDMDGGDVQQALLASPGTQNIPVIFLSGLITKEEEGDVKGQLYISKSSTKEEIIQKIKSVLGIK